MCKATCSTEHKINMEYYDIRISDLEDQKKKLKKDLSQAWKEIQRKNEIINELSAYSQRRCRANFLTLDQLEDDGK